MVSNLQILGIYEDAIDTAIKKCEKFIDIVNGNPNELHEEAQQILQETGSFNNITNSIINAYFQATTNIVESIKPSISMSFYVNCHDSHIFLNGELENESQESDIEEYKEWPHQPCVNYEDGCEEWAGCPCVYHKPESEE